MKKAFLVLAFLPLMAIHGQAFGASFDCQKAKTPVETMICGDRKLSSLDEEADLRFTQALGNAPDKDAFLTDQKAWLVERDACGSEKCVKKAYEKRLKELQKAAATVSAGATPDAAQIRKMLSKNYGLSAFAARPQGSACLLKNCGRSGPFEDLPALCRHLRNQFQSENPDNEFRSCRWKKMRSDDPQATQPVSFPSGGTGGMLDALAFPIEVIKDADLEVDFLALQTDQGWWIADELAQVDLGGAMGVSGTFAAKKGEYLPLVKKMPPYFALTFERTQINLDNGLAEASTFTHRSLLICRNDSGAPLCSFKIPLEIIEDRDVVVYEDEADLKRRRREQKADLYHSEIIVRKAFDEDKGTITLSPQKGNLPKELAPFMGTFKVEDLVGWRK